MIRRPLSRIAAALAAALALFSLPALGSAAASTTAAWTDGVHAAAPVSAGTWQSAIGCAWYVGGVPQPAITCTVTGGRIDQWAENGVQKRNYYVNVSISQAAAGYAVLTVDLSTISGGNPAAWNWSTAVTLPGGHLTSLPGFLCSELPVLRAQGPSNWWQTAATYYFQLESPSSGASKTCG